MGNTHSDITESEFKKCWRVSDRRNNFTLWENRDDANHKLEQYSVEWDDHVQNEELYQLRRNHAHLVNAYALRHDGASCGSDHDRKNVFLERIPLRLSNVQDIPFPATLHLYDASINGYRQLKSVTGPFRIDEDQIGINQSGQVKVWCNTAFEANGFMRGQGCPEPVMISDLLQVLNENSDNSSYPPGVPTLHNHLSSPNIPLSFNQLEDRYVEYIRRYTNSEVPTALPCVDEVGGARSINSWCRTNQSYGFHGPNTRISESVYQSKLVRNSMYSTANQQSQSQEFVQIPNETITVHNNSSVGQPCVLIAEVPQPAPPQVVSNPPVVVPPPGPVQAQAPVFVSASPSTPVASPPSSSVIPNLPAPISPKNRPLPQIREHPEENMSSVKRVGDQQSFPPARQEERQMPVPLMVQGAPSYTVPTSYHEPQHIRVEKDTTYNINQSQKLQGFPPQSSQTAVQLQQGAAPSQQVNQVGPMPTQTAAIVSQPRSGVVQSIPQPHPQHPRPQIQHQPSLQQPKPIQVVQTQQVEVRRERVSEPVPVNRGPASVNIASPIGVISQTSPKGEPVRSVFAESHAQPVHVDASGPVPINVQSGAFPSSEAYNMQHQRVLSQKYEVKQDVKPVSGALDATYEPTYQVNTSSPEKHSGVQLSSYGRGVGLSHSINEEKVTTHEDGKSSPEFLALISQLKDSIGKGGHGQVYSEVADTPATYKHQNEFSYSGNRANASPAAEVFAQSTTSAYDAGNASNAGGSMGDDYYSKYIAQLTSGSGVEGGNYGYTKYESNIDPELQADLKKYQ